MDSPFDRAKKPAPMWWAIGFVWEVFFSIAIPTTVFALGGRWLDVRYHSSPLFVIVGLALSLGVIYVIVKREVKQLNDYLKERCKRA